MFVDIQNKLKEIKVLKSDFIKSATKYNPFKKNIFSYLFREFINKFRIHTVECVFFMHGN